MIEKKIYLDIQHLVDFYGINNVNIQKIRSFFPKLKVISRGNEIAVSGETREIALFEDFLDKLITRFNIYNKLTEKDIELIFNDEVSNNKNENKILIYGNSGLPVKAKNKSQERLISEFQKKDLIFAIGPAGTGKTYIAISLAVKALRNREIKRIVLSRPAVEAGEHLGFLPGDLKDKLDPYLQALYDAMHDLMPGKRLNDYIEQGVVQIAPLAYMRGRTLSNSIVILDEAQNATVSQIKMFLTRMGENSKFIVTGDITQIDLPNKSNSGLIKVSQILKNTEGISFVNFNKHDIVRHQLVSKIVEAFDEN